jgi:hypothetical protein
MTQNKINQAQKIESKYAQDEFIFWYSTLWIATANAENKSPSPKNTMTPKNQQTNPCTLTTVVAPLCFNDYDNSNILKLHVPSRNLCGNTALLDIQRYSILCGTTLSDIASKIYPRLIVTPSKTASTILVQYSGVKTNSTTRQREISYKLNRLIVI